LRGELIETQSVPLVPLGEIEARDYPVDAIVTNSFGELRVWFFYRDGRMTTMEAQEFSRS